MKTDSGKPETASGTTSTTMRAIVHDAYGEADVLRLERIDRPEIGEAEVLVRVQAAGVDQGLWHIMAGLPYPIRLAGYGFRAPKTRVRGRELAGRVEAVGSAVTTFRPGDEVVGIGEGALAECAAAAAGKLAPRRTGLPGRRPRSPSPAPPRCRPCAITAACIPANGCWSSARRAASGPTRCRSPRPSGRR